MGGWWWVEEGKKGLGCAALGRGGHIMCWGELLIEMSTATDID